MFINQLSIKTHPMHLFGFVAFVSTFVLAIIAIIHHPEDAFKYLSYGTLIFVINVMYLKMIILSRQDYEAQLKKEKKYSQELVQSQKIFLRHAVHETNTPLAVIMANIELYELELGKHPLLSNIEAATKNIYGIYDDLSYLTKKDQISYPKKKIQLFDFVQSRVHFFNIVAQQSQLSLELINKTKLPFVYINESKLQRIVDNNITNAIKYTKEYRPIHIIIFENESTYVLEISSYSTIIKDTRKIFDAYYRENKKKEGLGLGLNLVKIICEEEDIKITLTSEENTTIFRYYFKKAI